MAKSWIELGLMQGWPPPVDKTVTLANYDHDPFPRWSMINMRELIPSRLIRRGAQERQLIRNPRDLRSFRFQCDGVEHDLAAFLDQTYVDALMVIHNDEVVFEHFDEVCFDGELVAEIDDAVWNAPVVVLAVVVVVVEHWHGVSLGGCL